MGQHNLNIDRTDQGNATFPPLIVKLVAEAVDEAAMVAEDDTADGDEAAVGVLAAPPISMVLIIPTPIGVLQAANGRP
jgi:hypothetical protein